MSTNTEYQPENINDKYHLEHKGTIIYGQQGKYYKAYYDKPAHIDNGIVLVISVIMITLVVIIAGIVILG